MERYENLGLVGEGSYGMVLKCRHKETGQIVAIKKFIESEDDKTVKKIALREIKMLKQLRHENLVNLLEVFRRKKRLFLVFEYVDRTILDDLEKYPDGLEEMTVRKVSFQVLRGLEFCHSNNIIHRDVKPENILISASGIVKLCDFGFARTLATGPGEVFTDYVATRWYRAPELLVGDVNYGKAVDIWAVGCLIYEMITGDPLFPGDSDIDQLFHITKTLGNLTQRHKEVFFRNPLFSGMRLPSNKNTESIGKRFSNIPKYASDLIVKALNMDASQRLSCLEMMKHPYYHEKNFAHIFLESLKVKIEKETTANPLLKSLAAQKSMKLHNTQNQDIKTNNEIIHLNNERDESALKNSLKKKKNDSEKKQNIKQIEISHKEDPVKHQRFEQSETLELHKKHTTTTTNEKHVRINENKTTNKISQESDNEKNNSHENLTKQDSETLENKHCNRTPLDMSITQPGKNLPEICSFANINRARGHDVIKQKKHSKKSLVKPERELENSMLCPVAEKASICLDPSKSIDDMAKSDKYKRKDSKIRDVSDLELPKMSGLILPSVMAKNVKTSPTRGTKKTGLTSTIPHIQNIDPFPATFSTVRDTTTNNSNRNHRDGNLPAV